MLVPWSSAKCASFRTWLVPFAGVRAEQIRRPLDEPLCGQDHVVHECLGGHDRDGEFTAEDLVVVHPGFVHGLFEPEVIQFFHHVANSKGIAQGVVTDGVVHKCEFGSDGFAYGGEDREIFLPVPVGVKLVGLNARYLASSLDVCQVTLQLSSATCLVDGENDRAHVR